MKINCGGGMNFGAMSACVTTSEVYPAIYDCNSHALKKKYLFEITTWPYLQQLRLARWF